MKLILTLASPKDPKEPTSLTVQGSDDTGGELLSAKVADVSKLAEMLPRLLALSKLLPEKPK